MIITYFGIILFLVMEWIKFIKTKVPLSHERFGVAYVSDRARHEASI